MVNVIQPVEEWAIVVKMVSSECPWIYYPNNITGCKHPANINRSCGKKGCPILMFKS